MDRPKPKCEFCGCSHITGLALIMCELKSVRAQLAEEKKGRERDREEFRKGVAAWQEKISDAEKRESHFRHLLARAREWVATDTGIASTELTKTIDAALKERP